MATGIILAGGKSSRMGANKALLQMGEQTIIDHILVVFKNIFKEIIIVTNSPQEYEHCGVRVVKDIIPESGPLGGIYTGLKKSQDELCFVTACDMPFIQENLIRYIVAIKKYDIVVPVIKGIYQPLFAQYSKGCIPVIAEQLRQEKRSINDIYKLLSIKVITVEKLWTHDNISVNFTNINTPEEFSKALKLKNGLEIKKN